MLLSLAASSALLYGPASQPNSVRASRCSVLSCTLAEAPAVGERLQQISAAPRSPGAFELAERLSTQTLAEGAWRHAFRQLVTDADFLSHGWAQRPFKLHERWDFAIGSFTMADVEADVTLMPPQFVASGVRFEQNGVVGIYNQPFNEGFSFADVDTRMDKATVVMLNGGFCVPALAAVSKAMLEATQLPIWLNVYLSKPGLTTSTQLHTDKQDVLLIQTTGRKRWRVYRPPPPSDAPAQDPFARGKGTDLMQPRMEDLLLDTVMEPGQVLYIPAGFPHDTDTIGEVTETASSAAAAEPSVHLTVGVDTHLWGLNYAKMRELALQRKGVSTALEDGAPVTTLPPSGWSALHAPLPLGFLAAPLLEDLCGDAGARVNVASAEQALAEAMAVSLAERLQQSEPDRWASKSAAELVSELELQAVAARMLEHHREVLATQTRMYVRTAYSRPETARERREAIAALMDDMDRLDASTSALGAWASGLPVAPAAGVAAAAAPSGGFGGMGGAKKAAGGKKGGKPKKKR